MFDDEPEVIGKWIRKRVLGKGAFGIVTLWSNPELNEKIAIKKYRGDLESSLTAKQKERWTKEVEMMQRIDNCNIVSFRKLPLDLEKELHKYNPTNLPMLSMEFCTEGDLRGILSRAENCCGLPESDVRYILSDLMNAVSYLHTLKITHRDLKPENVVLQVCDRPNKIIYKLIDLGYAKEIDASSVAASFVGTLQYLAPEFFYSKTYSCSVDYWSLGLVAFEVICGIRPFLPNMSPAQWIKHVQNKQSGDICVYQEIKGDIKYSKEVFIENHISSYFKKEVENWLHLALEFNPKKRGYVNFDPLRTDNELVIFKNLKKLLEKKIITVFSVYTCKFYSYEIDDFTLMTTVQGWVERDTKIAKTEQVLLSTICDTILMDGLATQCFDQTYTTEPMLYVFKKSVILNDEIVLDTPALVLSMLENTTSTLPYYFQKISYAHALYFTFKENKYYNTVLDACNLKIKNMIKFSNGLKEKCNTMVTNMHMLIAQKNLCKEILDFDVKQYLKHFSQNASHWISSYTTVANEIDKLYELSKRLNVRYESAFRRIHAIHNASEKEYSKYSKHDLDEKLNEALVVYKKVRCKDKHDKPESCLNMVKVLYNVLKSRDKLLKNILFIQYQQKIVDLDFELEKIKLTVNTALQHVEKIKSDLFADQIARQTKIWEFTIKQKPKTKNTEQVFTKTDKQPTVNTKDNELRVNFQIGDEKVDQGEPISLKKPLHFILGEANSISPNSSINSSQSSLAMQPTRNSLKSNQENIEPEVSLQTLHSKSEIGAVASVKNIKSNQEKLDSKISLNKGTNIHKAGYPNFHIGASTSIANNPVKSDKENTESESFLRKSLYNFDTLHPNFLIGAPTSVIISDNQNLRYELQEKTNESFLKCKSILNENLDFSFLEST